MGVESWNVFTNLEGVTVVTAENIFSICSHFLRGSWFRSEQRKKCLESLRVQLTEAGQFAIFYWCYEYVWGLAKCWHRRRDCVLRWRYLDLHSRSRSNDDTLIQRPAAAPGPVNRWSQSCCLPIFPGLCYPLDTPHLNGTAQSAPCAVAGKCVRAAAEEAGSRHGQVSRKPPD